MFAFTLGQHDISVHGLELEWSIDWKFLQAQSTMIDDLRAKQRMSDNPLWLRLKSIYWVSTDVFIPYHQIGTVGTDFN